MLVQRPFHWLETRRWELIWPGIPALIVGISILVPTILRPAFEQKIVSRYRSVVQDALKAEDYDQAATYLRKLIHLGHADDDVVKYNLALVEARKGDFETAKAAIMALAPSDSEGYGPAHLWVAKLHLREKKNWHKEETGILVHHLKTAIKLDPSLSEAHLILGEIYLRTKDFPGAVEHFSAVADREPRLHLTLAQLHKELKDPLSAKQEFDRAASYFRELVLREPDDEKARIDLARVYYQQDKFPTAETILLEGLKRNEKSVALRGALSQLCLNESDRIANTYKSADPLYGDSLTMLGKALSWAPNNVAALNRITRFIGVKGDVGRRARAGLTKILAAGRGTASIHMILGTNALIDGDFKTAETHLNLANKLQPSMPAVLNNMAWMYMQSKNPRYEDAYAIATKAIGLLPGNHPLTPSVYETRGQILVRLKRYEEALNDLTLALPYMKNNKKLHESLAKTYSELGQTALADEHKAIADGLLESNQG